MTVLQMFSGTKKAASPSAAAQKSPFLPPHIKAARAVGSKPSSSSGVMSSLRSGPSASKPAASKRSLYSYMVPQQKRASKFMSKLASAPVRAVKTTVSKIRDMSFGQINMMEVLMMFLVAWMISMVTIVDAWEAFVLMFAAWEGAIYFRGNNSRAVKFVREASGASLERITNLLQSITEQLGQVIGLIIDFVLAIFMGFWSSIVGLLMAIKDGVSNGLQRGTRRLLGGK